MPLNPGQVVHQRYRIESLLGQGGMGNVYRAYDLSLKLPVALKENLETSPAAQKQFAEEATILARLSHPNLPRVTDYFSLPGQGEYLVMDFIEGDDLEMTLDDAGGAALPASDVLPWAIQVLSALSYLHRQKPPVIHRDIKPANIKIRPDPAGGISRAILVDFGIAKAFDSAVSTLTGARAVTPGYSPPEQYGSSATDARSDIYSLGATLYHLLTGQKPPESVQRMSGSLRMASPRLLRPALSQELTDILLKAMAIPIENRYQSAGEMSAALSAVYRFEFGAETSAPQPAAIPGLASPSAGSGLSSAARPPSSPPGKPPTPVQPLPHKPLAPSTGTPTRPVSWPIWMVGGTALLLVVLVLGRLISSAASRPLDERPPVTVTVTSLRRLPTLTEPARVLTPLAGEVTAPDDLPTPIVTPTLPDWPVWFTETFDNNRHGWLTGIMDTLSCWVLNGQYWCQIQANTAATHWVSAFRNQKVVELGSKFVLSSDIQFKEGPPASTAGLTFRDSEAGRYLFSIRADGLYRLSSIQDSPPNWIDLVQWTASDAIRPNGTNTLTVSANGDTYSLYINGQFVTSFTDSLWQGSRTGLHMFSATGSTPALFIFDNYTIKTQN